MRKNDLRTSEVFVVAPFLPQGENLLWQNSMIKKNHIISILDQF